jgi:hypothetical protein
MSKKFKPFLLKFQELIEKEGYEDISKFVNDWINKGETFRTLHQWVLLKGLDFEHHTVWTSLRKYLTVPFDASSSFWNKWNSTAQTKGFNSAEEMMEVYRKKYTATQMATELAVTPRTIEYLLRRLDGNKDLPLKEQMQGKRPSHRDEDGFTKTDVKEKWTKLLNEKGFTSLREAANYYMENKIPPTIMARELGVTERALRIRMEKAGILLSKETEAAKNSPNSLGLL